MPPRRFGSSCAHTPYAGEERLDAGLRTKFFLIPLGILWSYNGLACAKVLHVRR